MDLCLSRLELTFVYGGDKEMVHIFTCGGVNGHPGFHLSTKEDDRGQRFLMIWEDQK